MSKSPPAADPGLGVALKGRYRLESALGQGRLGTTYRAYDETLKRPVAVKLTAEDYAEDAEFRRRFMSAAAAAGRLSHPNIVTVLDAGLHEGRPFIVMELVEGHNLRQLLDRREPISVSQCLRLAAQIADALAYAHGQRVVHGDLRPENVLISGRGVARVVGFGLARPTERNDPTEEAGSRPRGSRNRSSGALADQAADLHALGTLFYELLTGARPPGRGQPPAPSSVRSDVPATVDRVALRAISGDPRERYLTAQEMRTALVAPRAESIRPEVWLPPRGSDAWRRHRRAGPGLGQLLATLVPLLATLALIAGAVMAVTGVVPRLFSGMQVVEVPSLIDLDAQGAVTRASALGLEARVTSSQPTEDRAAGVVLAQSPPAGSRVRRGGEIKLTVSAGIRPPDVAGRPLDEAKALLSRAGWAIAGVEPRADSDVPTGTVVGTHPGPDQAAPSKEIGLVLLISAGNLAYHRPVFTNSGTSAPPELVDGDVQTAGPIADSAPAWVEIALARPATVAGVELVTSQDRPGVTIHEVWVWTVANEFRGMHTFVGPTTDNQTLTVRFPEPVSNVRAVRIATTQASGTFGWREIKIFER